MKPWTVRQLHDSLTDLITRRPGSAGYTVILLDQIDSAHYGAGLTSVEPDYELAVVKLVAEETGERVTRRRHEDTADTGDSTRK